MRVLWVTAEAPDRGGGGGNIRQALLLESVAAAGHEVDLLLAGTGADAETRAVARRVIEVPVTRTRRPDNRWAGRALEVRLAVHGGPSELHDGSGARRGLSRAWPEGRWDVVFVEHAALAPLVHHRRPGEHWTCTLHNVASGTASALAEFAPGTRQRLMIARDAQQAAAVERRVVRDYDSVITVSREDAALLTGPSTVIPNGVDLRRFHPTPLPPEARLLFTATLSYLPNVDGLRWFCSEVLPLVRAQVPHVVFDIVGRDPVAEVRELAHAQGVQLHENVPAVMPYLEASRVCVVPLRVGTGSRLKALEAMAAGRPVVGTTVGMMGLDLTDQAVVEDEPAAMAAALTRLLHDNSLAQDLARRGREHVERSFGWDRIGRLLVEHLEQVTSP